MKPLLGICCLYSLAACTTTYPGETSQYESFAPDGIEIKVAETPWTADMHGNHRAIVQVSGDEAVAKASLKWRRPDLRPDTKKVVVTDAQGNEVQNVFVQTLNAEEGTILFEPTTGKGTYYIYYLPYKYRKGWDDARYGKPWNDYLAPVYEADAAWVNTAKQTDQQAAAKVVGYESRTQFDYFTPMGLIATQAEEDSIKTVNPSNPVVFIEDRAYPVRLKYNLPVKWKKNTSHNNFEGKASPNEYYTWQIALWAARDTVEDVKLTFSDFKNGSSVIPADQATCFNQEGINWDGKPLSFDIDLSKGQVQPLWCGIQIPENAKQGTYTGTATLHVKGKAPEELTIAIHVSGEPLADKGDGELWRHSRLRWLNSQIGVDSLPVTPYTAITTKGNEITVADKSVSLQPNGLISNVKTNNRALYAAPLRIVVQTGRGDVVFSAEDLEIKQPAPGLVEWKASSIQDGLLFTCKAYMEYDGFIRYVVSLAANQETDIKDIKVESDYTAYASTYFMGAGFKGGLTPKSYTWNWAGPYDSYWIGNEEIGAHIELRGGTYHGPLLNDYKPAPPIVWSNHGAGRVSLVKSANNTTKVVASTGACTLGATPTNLEFDVLLTPVKKLNSKKHFSERYFHSEPSAFDSAATEGANIANIHHARNLNPVINYPFIVRDSLIQFIKHQHEYDRKVKLYYTIRELTNYTTEIYALMSLGNEIFHEGPGYGTPWHTEHLIDGYKPAWYTELPGENADAALVLSGFSRWINYYLEGLRWMFENYEIDGIYMDDVSFDRNVMKRMRKIMEQYHPGALIDLHSNTGYSIGPMNQYTDFFPYIDRLWFGESFKYNQMTPDEWFVTFSGIPFGMMSEMLQDGGNRFLGMVYGTTARHSYGPYSPAPVWALWKSFGIEDATMIGYWNDACPVKTNNADIKATCYVKDGATLIALGNFSDKTQSTTLSFDWKALGLDPTKVKVVTPEVEDFQEANTYSLATKYTINPKEGLLLMVEE